MPAKKPADRRHNSKTRDYGEVVALSPTVTRRPPADLTWLDEIQSEWAELWSSPMAQVFKPTDLPSLRRLFHYRSQHAAATERFLSEPEVVGSMGQPVLSPWAGEMHRLEAQIQKLEDRCGLSPLARLRLGITFEEGVSLASRNTQLLEAFRNGTD